MGSGPPLYEGRSVGNLHDITLHGSVHSLRSLARSPLAFFTWRLKGANYHVLNHTELSFRMGVPRSIRFACQVCLGENVTVQGR
jgi:hypothetical protein